MFIETARTQAKLREIFHEEICPGRACEGLENEASSCYRIANRSAVLTLGKLMPTLSGEMFPSVRADERGRVGHRIRAELVCCDLYDRLNATRPEDFGMTVLEWATRSGPEMAKLIGARYHDICHWGGYAAAIAEQGPTDA